MSVLFTTEFPKSHILYIEVSSYEKSIKTKNYVLAVNAWVQRTFLAFNVLITSADLYYLYYAANYLL